MSANPEALALPAAAVESPWRRLVGEFLVDPVASASLVLLAVLVLAALAAPFVAPQNPYDLATVSVMDARLSPGERGSGGFVMWLGADGAGRDMLSGMLYGLRISLGVGVASGLIAFALGMAIGLTAAYAGGRTDAFIMRVADLQLSFPAILVALILVAILGKGVDKVIVALVLVQWAYYARTVRGSALVERRKEYIEAAHCLALPASRIVFRHLLPNCLAPMIVVGTLQTAHAISLEATLSFLGVGLPQTEPSLGLLISNGFEYMLSGKYWISFFPGVALLLTIMSINLVGDRLRDVLNPRLER
jgi:peptide/nickel transport system permease protein